MNRKVLLIGVAAMFVCGLAWTFLLYRPAGTDLADAKIELESVNNELSQLDTQLGRLRSIEADLPRLQSGIETLRSAVPDDSSLAEFILSINEAAIAAGLDVSSIVPDQPRSGTSGLLEINIGLNTAGGYYKILDFLNRMSALHRVITVENIGLTALRDDNPAQEPMLQLTMQARIYVNPVAGDVAPAPDDSQPADTGSSEDESGEGL